MSSLATSIDHLITELRDNSNQDHVYSQPLAPPPPPSQQQETQQLPTPQSGNLPSLQEAHRTNIPTLTHVPKAARGQWAKVLTDLSNRVSEHPEAHTLWVLLLIFPRCIMHAGRYRQADARAQARLVKERLDRWRHGQYRELWDEAVSSAKVPARGKSRRTQTDATQEEKNTK